MAHYTTADLQNAAKADSPGLFNRMNNAPEMEEAKQNALSRVAGTLKALGHTVEGYEDDAQD